jgi:hypothetical protein
MSEPQTKHGKDAVRLRGLFGGETEARAGAWVALIEQEASSEPQRLLKYLWDVADIGDGFKVCDLFHEDDPLTTDIERVIADVPDVWTEPES